MPEKCIVVSWLSSTFRSQALPWLVVLLVTLRTELPASKTLFVGVRNLMVCYSRTMPTWRNLLWTDRIAHLTPETAQKRQNASLWLTKCGKQQMEAAASLLKRFGNPKELKPIRVVFPFEAANYVTGRRFPGTTVNSTGKQLNEAARHETHLSAVSKLTV